MVDAEAPLEALLREAAQRGDALADGTVEAFVRNVRPEDLLDYLQNVIRLPTQLHLDDELKALGEQDAARKAFRDFLEEMARRPQWISDEQVEAGTDFFRKRVSAAALSLGCASLPTCYCWEPEAGVLMYTQRLALETPRRILETAQFVLDVMTPGGLRLGRRPFARGVRAAQKVRLMHAVIRYMLRNRDTLLQHAYARYDAKTEDELEHKARSRRNPWIGFLLRPGPGLPINQEQLAGTLLTFSIVILQSFRRICMRVSREQEQSYLHAWNVVGYLLGLEKPLLDLTADYESAERVRLGIMARHRRRSEHAERLTSALSAYLAEDIELLLGLQKWLPVHRIPRLTMWMLLERETLDACGVQRDRVDRVLYVIMRPAAILFGLLHNVPWVRAISTLLFDYLSRNVWAWRTVPFAGARSASPLVRGLTLPFRLLNALWLRLKAVFGLGAPLPVGQRIRNWSDTAQTQPAEVTHPSTTREIAEILTATKRYPGPVRVMGSYHSTAACAGAEGGTLIRLDRLKRVLEIGTHFVEAEAGALYVDVAHELHRRGLEFFVNLQIGNITMGAAACTTTKDGSYLPEELAQASSYCTAMTIVRPDGQVVRIEERAGDESSREAMRLARSSHGLLGMVCAVRFKVRPIQHISIEHRNVSVAEFLQELPGLMNARDCSVEYYLYPFIDRVSLKIRRKSASRDVNRWVWRLRNFTIARVIPIAARILGGIPGRKLRDLVSALFYRAASFCLQWLCNAQATYGFDQTTRYPDPPGKYAFTFSMWAFPEASFPRVLREYIALVKTHRDQTGYRSHMPTVGYVICQDTEALLSYAWSGRVITIDPTAIGDEGWRRFTEVFNDFASARGGIPLFNQTPGLNAGHMAAFGARLQRFEATRRQVDPGDRLLNSYFRNLLP